MSKNLIEKLNQALESGELFEMVDNSLAAVQVVSKLGYSNKGQYAQIVRTFLQENDIDISHFTPNGQPSVKPLKLNCLNCDKVFSTEDRKEKTQRTCSRACSNTYFRTKNGRTTYRQRAVKEYGMFCQLCGYDNFEALEVHHKDKNRQNNDLSNLIVLCANCHRIEHKNKIPH